MMKKIKLDNLAKFFDTTRQTVARWKKEDNKLALDFAHKYLDDDLLEEFFKKEEKFQNLKIENLKNLQKFKEYYFKQFQEEFLIIIEILVL